MLFDGLPDRLFDGVSDGLPDVWREARRVLAIRLDNIGDMVMLSPALRTLRQNLAQVHITLMASPAGSQVAPLLPWVDEVLVRRVVWQDVSGALPLDPVREWNLVEAVRGHRFDAAVIFTSFTQSPYPPAYLCYLAGIPVRLGQSREFGGGLLSQWVRPLPDEAHQVDRNLHLLAEAGFRTGDRSLALAIPPDAQAAADGLLNEVGIGPGAPFVALAPGASAETRRYPAGRYREVARLLVRRLGWPVVLLGSERETPAIEPVLEAVDGRHVVTLAGRTSVPQLAGVIRRASLVVASHSGPMHIADALRRPMVILFSGSDLASQWWPRSAPASLLNRPTDCSPCHAFRCPFHLECLDIPAPEVVEQACSLLTAIGRQGGVAGERTAPLVQRREHLAARQATANLKD